MKRRPTKLEMLRSEIAFILQRYDSEKMPAAIHLKILLTDAAWLLVCLSGETPRHIVVSRHPRFIE
jgi:hypothetical protein